VAEVQDQFGNSGEKECPSLEAVTRRLVKAVTEDSIVCMFNSDM
jgi:hypothetical protein